MAFLLHLDSDPDDLHRWRPICGLDLYKDNNSGGWLVIRSVQQRCTYLEPFLEADTEAELTQLLSTHEYGENGKGTYCATCTRLANKNRNLHLINASTI